MVIKIEGLSKKYQQGSEAVSVLDGVNLAIGEPRSVSLMGRSGCGKSTLISLLAGLDRPSSGRVEVLGRDLNQLSAQELNRFRATKIGIIFQQFHLLDHLTALENVRLPLDLDSRADAEERAIEALRVVGLGHRVQHFPEQLSRGECQRVAIARVLMREPEILLADEPTGSLDLRTGQMVMDLLLRLQSEKRFLFFLVTHDPRHAEACNQKLYMSEGRLMNEKPSELL
jgi:putative ABC transport system ATP-binding protein